MTKEAFRLPVIGYLIVRMYDRYGGFFITAEPMVFDCSPDDHNVIERGLIEKDDEILGVVPAAPNSYAVYTENDLNEPARFVVDGMTDPSYNQEKEPEP
jgi:hypothetical protein